MAEEGRGFIKKFLGTNSNLDAVLKGKVKNAHLYGLEPGSRDKLRKRVQLNVGRLKKPQRFI
ncbi:hypothetical protein LCGC14_0683540 [marine sediment metagenome]|uniref:Uncharacterized protein n=1 Tax=marine sediment metagenome TaxID=412755 RepID=A0A0F9TVI6_9ZZZZ